MYIRRLALFITKYNVHLNKIINLKYFMYLINCIDRIVFILGS